MRWQGSLSRRQVPTPASFCKQGSTRKKTLSLTEEPRVVLQAPWSTEADWEEWTLGNLTLIKDHPAIAGWYGCDVRPCS